MTMLPPAMFRNTGFGGYMRPDVQPFTYRDAITYTELQERLKEYVLGLADQVNDSMTGLEGVIDNYFQLFKDAQTQALDPLLANVFITNGATAQATGSLWVPAPTGNATTDTAAFKASIALAQAARWDLHFTRGATQKTYVLNDALTWSLSRGSLVGHGHVGLDFGSVPTSYAGGALKIVGEQGDFNEGAHLAATHRVVGFRMIGHQSDTSTMDGILVSDTAGNIDMGRVVAVQVYGFRDGLTFGDNVWSVDFMKCAVSASRRYGINLHMGTNAGECISLTHTSIYGTKNAAGTAGVAIYAPQGSNNEFRMIGGSLDYNFCEGIIENGQLTFIGVHIEDNSTGAMFVYNQIGAGRISVAFRDCSWDSSTPGARFCIHQILSTSSSKVMLVFDGDKGGVYPNTNSLWLLDDTKNLQTGDANMQLKIENNNVDGAFLLGQACSMVPNGSFDENTTLGTNGASTMVWFASTFAGGTYSIGPGGNPGAGLTLASTQVANHYASIMIPVRPNQPYSMGGKLRVSALTAGAASYMYEFYGDDGTTMVSSGRVGSQVTAVGTDFTFIRRVTRAPRGARYLKLKLVGEGFIGTAIWDQVEVVPL